MRADRLVSILLLLQARGQVTAAEVATELEVSTRTARRDLEALAMSGVPIYSQAGRGGGWRLLGGACTDLTGLTSAEARALFLTVGSISTTRGASSPALQSAVAKLMQAVPEPFRDDAGRATDVALVDEAGWGRTRAVTELPFLEPIQDALVAGRQLELGYRDAQGRSSSRTVDPLGVVAKAGVWYLIAQTQAGQRTFRIDRVTSTHTLDTPANQPDDFDLAAAWRDITVRVGELRHPVRATGRTRPDLVRGLWFTFGDQVRVGPLDDEGWHSLEINGESEEILAIKIAGFVSSVEIHDPPGVVAALARIGDQLVATYR